MKKEKYEAMITVLEMLEAEADKALEWHHTNIKKVDGFKHLEFKVADWSDVSFEGEANWSYGGHEDYYFSLDARYIYDEDFKNSEVLRVAKEKKKLERAEAKKETDDRKAQEKRERANYLKLKEKYGD